MKPKPSEYQQISFAVARVLNRFRIIIAINIEYSKFNILLGTMNSQTNEYQQISIADTRVLNRI